MIFLFVRINPDGFMYIRCFMLVLISYYVSVDVLYYPLRRFEFYMDL